MSTEFRVGDVVEFGGVEEKIVDANNHEPYPLITSSGQRFTLDGRFLVEHTKPLLTLVHRAKKKVKKSITGYVNVYEDGNVLSYIQPTYSAAKEAAIRWDVMIADAIAVPVTIEYEVEE